MGIILSILKILGIILLVILGIVLLAVFIVLFVPVRYRILGQVHEKTYLEGNIFWLLHLLRAKVSYEDELLYIEIGILWKKISFTKESGVSGEEESEDDLEDDLEESKVEEQSSKNVNDKIPKNHKFADTDKRKSASAQVKENTKEKETLSVKMEKLLQAIKEKLAFVKKKASQMKKLIQDEKNKQAVKHLKDELIYLVKILLPKKSSLKGVFSTGSPDTTGQAFGVIACFPIMYQNKWSLTPDFEAEKAYFEGDFQGKGRIYGVQLVGILLRIVIDKNCRRLYYILKRLGGRTDGRRK